ncbi:hypothetical protein EDD36DRAFT_132116 [Exophiala viscosa]|uniref:HTH La-type RNA-binding domain-containing protein n=1 Tax=Exophiala viscosa TaxID=2486360 RepID=A0AAN6IIB2_9EURO|nr:hypothetical protein EDD36DRAFT_132116 [Exophiala viscosa]
MSTPLSAAAPVFSYAQAAKGLTPSTTIQATPRNESPASEKGIKDRQAADAESALKSPQEKPVPDDKISPETTLADTPAKDLGDKEPIPTTQQTLSADQDVRSNDHVDAPINTASHDSRKDEARPQLANGRTYSSAQVSDTSGQGLGEKKPKESEDDWEKVSVPSMTAEKEFKAAPIPAVNVWQQRAAKLKDLAIQPKSTTASVSATPKPKASNEDAKRKSLSKDVDNERDSKNAEISRSNSRKDSIPTKSSRSGPQHGERTSGETPPTVGDSQAWPTPENSHVEERRKSSSLGANDKTEPKGPQKKWTTMAFVPTAKFETQLPPSVARRGGRGGGRGRDSTGRGGHASAAGEKQDSAGSMGPPPVPRQAGDQDRGRKSEGHRGARGASVPTSSGRPGNGEDTTPASRKPSTPVGTEQNGKDNLDNITSAVQGSGEHHALRTEHSSRSSSRHAGQNPAYATNGDLTATGEQPSGAYVPSPDQSNRQSYSFDRFKGAGNGATRGSGGFGRERGSGRNRDWSRDKPESAREKVESWRDREPSGDGSSRREPRPERGGRGGYRGRGNHAYDPTYGSSHAYTSPLPENGFESSRPSSHTESRSRQASQPFQPTQTPTNSHNNPRSQSIPVSIMFPGYYNGMPAMPQGPPSIQTDMQAYGYPSQMQMQPGIMSAMPFNDPLNSYALLSMVMTQVEYYFSIDNLCKDLFLRKHMDGQGYVPLSVIANFKRIKTLTDDNMALDTLRYVCQQVKSVEFLPGFDGDDRLRRRENWQDFILPVEERFESAQNDGPQHGLDQYHPAPQYQQPPRVDSSFGMDQLRSPPLNAAPVNGIFHPNPQMSSYVPGAQVDGNITGAPFSPPFEAAAPEDGSRVSLPPFAQIPSPIRSPPSHGPPVLGSFVNGHNRQMSRADIEDNVFPDENIPNINIRMQPHAAAVPETNGIDHNGDDKAPGSSEGGPNAEKSRVPSLRGGAASPQQLEQFRNWSFGYSGTIPVTDDTSISYFTKGGQETQLPPPQIGQYDQSYQSLHDLAFQQHEQGVEGSLEPLYSFWGDFLVDKFNLGMYQEFQATAVKDSQEGSDSGMKHLVRYFGKVLGGRIPISERLATDMVNLSREEKTNNRPLFHTLRAAWRNGATNMKTIKRLGDVLSAEEKAELDKSG